MEFQNKKSVNEIVGMNIPRFVNSNIPNEVDMNAVKLDPYLLGISSRIKQPHSAFTLDGRSEENHGSYGTRNLDQEQSRVDDSNCCSTSPVCAAPIIRQFWKAGVYNDELTLSQQLNRERERGKFKCELNFGCEHEDESQPLIRSIKAAFTDGSTYLHIHPRFLHSNATSHKWVFGAVAELIDNAVDEIQYGATYVIIDRISNPRNGSPALLIQDDGSGMDPEAMRRCLSFGFSDKKSISSIGRYGNGFKTSTMRLGADVIVFSRNQTNRTITQSIGLLSYTFLTRMGYDRVVVPMVHYEFNTVTGSFDSSYSKSDENSNLNLSLMLQWSPYSTEQELLKQFEDLGPQGTKIILYNLWLNEDGNMELDFESDPEDIRITRDAPVEMKDKSRRTESERHIANRLRYSLRAYLSVLYLKLPETFAMVLRGKVVLYRNVATDLKYTEFIVYKPYMASAEVSVTTTIGFLKEAPNVNIHGFNVYHKNRLILPFWPVVSFSANRGRGVVGVLEANFIEPTHDKQDFEKTSLFQKLVQRLKEMTGEDCHCGLIGYQFIRKTRPATVFPNFIHHHGTEPPALSRKSTAGLSRNMPKITTINSRDALVSNPFTKPVEPSFPRGFREEVLNLKRKSSDQLPTFTSRAQMEVDPQKGSNMPGLTNTQEAVNMMQENGRLRYQCNESHQAVEHLQFK
ncbi:hypothetical protein OSB04_004797, partial [Centaurea solstitialis]